MKYSTFSLLLIVLIYSTCSSADIVVRELGRENDEPKPYVFPYAFASDSMGFVVGAAGGVSGLPQEQNSLVATALLSDEGAAAAYLFFNNYQFADNSHIFLDISFGLGEFPQQRAYLDLGPPGASPPAGSNESDPDNYFEAEGYANWLEIDFKYVLNIGNAKYNPVNTYTLSNGLLVGGASGGEIFNPFKSGRSYVQLSLFHHDRDYETSSDILLSTSGVSLSFEYDNTDFPVNPSVGSIVRSTVRYDPGLNGREGWTVGEVEYSKFFKLPDVAHVNQHVFAFNAWTANTFSDASPPHYYAVTLGGLYRLRAFPIERFHDNSAIYYSAEYRLIPESNLLSRFSFLDFVSLDWWELALFYETGRVAPEWDVSELHDSMKWDMGLSLRVMANHDIARLDVAWAEEDTTIWLMYGHPF